MIVFFNEHPSEMNQADGFTQRVQAIDSLFEDSPRVYVRQITWKKWIKKVLGRAKYKDIKMDNVTIVHLHPVLSYFQIKKINSAAKVYYFHSIYSVERHEDFLKQKNVLYVLDIHGVVPEERQMLEMDDSEQYSALEKRVVPCFDRYISVTDTMAQHYISKYGLDRKRVITLPIFERFEPLSRDDRLNEKTSIIYAGGAQKWQNVSLMCQAATMLSLRFDFLFLTADEEEFSKCLSDEIEENVQILQVDKKELSKYYSKSDLGLVLRDEHIVNRVACPTKIIEYLYFGVIPIVIQPHIGDFNQLGYACVLLDDLLAGKVPNGEILEKMRTQNYLVVEKLEEIRRNSEKQLQQLVSK